MALLDDLITAGIPIISLVLVKNDYSPTFTRALTNDEWIIYKTIVYPARVREQNAQTEAALATELKTITPAEAVTWVDANVVDLTSAKRALKLLVRMVVAMRDKLWPEGL